MIESTRLPGARSICEIGMFKYVVFGDLTLPAYYSIILRMLLSVPTVLLREELDFITSNVYLVSITRKKINLANYK